MNAIAQRTFAALRFRNYRLYVASQLVSFSGTWMQALAQSWLVLELTGSGTALGTLLAFQFLPTLFLAPLGGLVADRFDKRRVLIGTQSFAGLLALTLGVLTMTGAVELWMVYLIAVGFGVNTALDNPTRQVFVMQMVGPEHITNAVTLNSVTVNAARAVGPAIGGVLIATLGIAECFIFNGFSYLAVIAAMILIDRSQLHPTPLIPRESGQLRQGMRYAWSTPALRTTLVILAMVGMFLFEFNVTLPLLADHTFGVGATGLAIMETLFGVGAVLGGLAVASAGQPTARRLVFVCAASGASVLALSVAPHVAVAYAVVPLVGAFSIATIAVGNATLQLNSAPHLRGRVMALFSVAVMGTTPIGGPIVGWIGDHVDPRAAVALGGLAGLSAAGFGWFQAERNRVFAPVPALVGAPAAGQ